MPEGACYRSPLEPRFENWTKKTLKFALPGGKLVYRICANENSDQTMCHVQ